MRYYPAMLDLRGRRCLLVGAGEVGRRKLAVLLDCEPAEVLALDPCPDEDALAEWRGHPAFALARRGFAESDLDGRFLVIAASSDKDLNARIAGLCAERGILCNTISDPEAGSFVVPAHIAMGELIVALSTAGQSPALARALRRDLREYLASRYDALLRLMGRLRPLALELNEPQAENARLFRSLVESPLAGALAARDGDEARRLLAALLPAALHGHMEELLDGLV